MRLDWGGERVYSCHLGGGGNTATSCNILQHRLHLIHEVSPGLLSHRYDQTIILRSGRPESAVLS